VFTNPFLVDLVLREGIEATLNEGTFIIRDAFNFAYYAMSKTQYLDNGKQKQDKLLTYFLEVPNVLLISFPISPIQLQIKANNLEACKKILDENPNYLTHVFWESGDSCLGVAAINGRGAICKLLLEHGANPGLKNKRGKTAEELWPLSEADNPFVQFRDELYQVVTKKGGLSEARRTQLLTLVIQYPHFLTLSVHKNGYNPLQYAFATNQTVMIEQILNLPEWNDLSKTKSKKGWSLFDIIAMNGQLAYYERLKLLPEDSSDWAFALRVSVIYNQEAFCRRLLADGVHPESIIASDGSTSLMIAAANGNSAMCNLLLKSGVNPLLKNKRSKAAVELWPSSVANNPFLQFGNELYYLATQKEGLSDARRTELLTLVIQYPHFLTFYIDQYQNNVVHYAFACNHTALIEKMLNLPEWNALSKTKNKKGWILFDMIALSGNLAYYEYLKPLPEDSYAWAFALRLAVENGHEEFCRLILAHGVKQSLMPDHHGVTPLMIAASNGNSPLCILLVECGADPKFKDLHGRIAEHYWPSSAVANPFLIWSFERRKAQLIQLIEDKISNAFWPERTVSSQKKAKLRDLQQKIAEGIVSAVDSSDMSSDDMLNEIVSAWETDNLKSNISNKILFFLPKNHSYGLIHSIVHDIKIILGPKSATSQNQIDRSRLNIRY
jgi:ankyrin repeat protein